MDSMEQGEHYWALERAYDDGLLKALDEIADHENELTDEIIESVASRHAVSSEDIRIAMQTMTDQDRYSDIAEALGRAEGSEILPKVILGSFRADDLCLMAKEAIEALLTRVELYEGSDSGPVQTTGLISELNGRILQLQSELDAVDYKLSTLAHQVITKGDDHEAVS